METANLVVRITSDGKGLSRGINEAAKDLKQFQGMLAGAGVVGAVVTFGRSLVELGGRLADLHDRTGISTTTIQQWQGSLEDSGASVEDLASAMKKLNLSINEALNGNKESTNAFNSLGVSMEKLRSLRTDEIFGLIADELARGDMNAQKLSDTIKLLGKNADKIVPAMRSGKSSESVIDPEAVAMLDDSGDLLARAWRATKLAGTKIAKGGAFGVLALKDLIEASNAGLYAYLGGSMSMRQGSADEGIVQMKAAFNAVYERRAEEEQARIERALGLGSSEFSRPKIEKLPNPIARGGSEFLGPSAPEWMQVMWDEMDKKNAASKKLPKLSTFSWSAIQADALSRIGLFRGGSNDVTPILRQQVSELRTAVSELRGIRNELNSED